MYIKKLMSFTLILSILIFFILSYAECKRYRESRINKVFLVETRSKSNEKKGIKDKCISTDFELSNFMNTSRWRLIRNKIGTGWDDSLIPPLMFCIKLLDKPVSLKSSCNKNNFELLIIDGIKKKGNSVVIANISNISKSEEKCVFISPCEILRRIYWNDKNFSNSVSNLEFRLRVTFDSENSDQRLLALLSLRGLARSLKKSKNPWDDNLKIVQKFKNVQAISLFIPYKPHSKSFVSDSCIVKPKITSTFYGNKPSLCNFENCMWNIWSGQLLGEFVNERCTIGKASSRGEYIVGWFSEYAIDSETTGSVKLKLQWNTSNQGKNKCSINQETQEKIEDYHEKELKGNFRSSWFPEDDSDITSTTTIGISTVEAGNNRDTDLNLFVTDALTTTTTTTTTITTISTHTVYESTGTHTYTRAHSNNSSISTTTTSRPKIKIIKTNRDNSISMCINGKCTHTNHLWTNCRFNRTRHLEATEFTNSTANYSHVIDPQVEWIDPEEYTNIYFDKKENSQNEINDYMNNVTISTYNITNTDNSTRIIEEFNANGVCTDEQACICILEGLADEDITLIEDADPKENEEDPLNDVDFENISSNESYETLLRKWQNLKKIYQA